MIKINQSFSLGVSFDKETYEGLAKIYIKHMVHEALIDFAKQKRPVINPETGKHLRDSFTFTVTDEGFSIHSDFPFSEEDPLEWIHQDQRKKGKVKEPSIRRPRRPSPEVEGEDSSIKRIVTPEAAPKKRGRWVHPGVARFSFTKRAVEKANAEALVYLFSRKTRRRERS